LDPETVAELGKMLEESKLLRRVTVATGPAFFEALVRDR
jgi:hypothetical protein